MEHTSDCAVHNAPAYPVGFCDCGAVKIKGEGDTETVVRTRVRRDCDLCGDFLADKRHSYLLPEARTNPQSSGYRKDDISWCSDHEIFTCAQCRPNGREPTVDGYRWCSTFEIGDRFAHMFLRWQERNIAPTPAVDRGEG